MLGGIGLERAGVLDWRVGVALAQGHVDSWWLAPAVAVVTAALFSAGLPGSLMVFVAGVLFPPAIAAPAVIAGGV
ncbi:MAG: associated Golgi protein, partial [Acidobacteriota bacterium]|nr:associated Golgi protein [Acidobacteriota bacterium]